MFRQARLPNKISIQKTKTTFFVFYHLLVTCNLSIVSIRRAATAIKIYIVITSIKNKTIETSHFMIKREEHHSLQDTKKILEKSNLRGTHSLEILGNSSSDMTEMGLRYGPSQNIALW